MQQQRDSQGDAATLLNKGFVDRIRKSDDEFIEILAQINDNYNLASEFGVTFCVPSACVNRSLLQQNLAANYDGIYDLIPNGRNISVTPSNVEKYFKMMEGAAKV